jgi:hypothetical protein
MTYPDLTACSSGIEARICILLIPFERKQFEVCVNVKLMWENITHSIKENTKKKTKIKKNVYHL